MIEVWVAIVLPCIGFREPLIRRAYNSSSRFLILAKAELGKQGTKMLWVGLKGHFGKTSVFKILL
jgi:hypothetical protein